MKTDAKLTTTKRKTIEVMAHSVLGYPNFDDSNRTILEIIKSGVDMIELQISFSDPVADGPVIMSANERALEAGATIESGLEQIQYLKSKTHIPIYIMSYYNLIYNYGQSNFCEKAKKIGVTGLIVPDYPLEAEEADHLEQNCLRNKLDLVPVISPNISDARLAKYISKNPNLIYCTARLGITGKSTKLTQDLQNFLRKLRRKTKAKLLVGFGISDSSQISALLGHADAIVVGSALIEIIDSNGPQDVAGFISSLKSASINA